MESSPAAAAAARDRYLLPYLLEPWAAAVADVAATPSGTTIHVAGPHRDALTGLAGRRAGPTGRVSTPAQPVAAGEADAVLCWELLAPGGQQLAEPPEPVSSWVRLLRPGGVLAAGAWASGFELEPYASIFAAAVSVDLAPPAPGAFAVETYQLSEAAVTELFTDAGLSSVRVQTVTRDSVWPDVATAVESAMGTVVGTVLAGAPQEQRRAYAEALLQRWSAGRAEGPVALPATAHLVRAVRAGGTAQ